MVELFTPNSASTSMSVLVLHSPGLDRALPPLDIFFVDASPPERYCHSSPWHMGELPFLDSFHYDQRSRRGIKALKKEKGLKMRVEWPMFQFHSLAWD